MPRKVARVRIVVVFVLLALVSFAAVKFVSYAQKRSAPEAPTAVTVTDTVAFAPGGDVNTNGKANPGDKLEGTIVVSASGAASTGTKVSIPVSSLLTLDNTFGTNGVQVSPLVSNDTYAATGNITISQPSGAGSLLANDFDPVTGNNTGMTTTAVTISSANCTGGCSGNVTINADGSFTYVSPPNFTGADSFVYTANTASGGSATATATVNVTDRIIFVSSGGVGNCRPATPCSLATADALAVPTSGKDLVYVLSGAYSSAAFTMNASQNLVGQGVSLAQARTDTGITLAANSVDPATAASTNPVFNNAGNIITLSTNNLVERFSLNPSGAAGTAGILSNAIASGTSTIRDLSSTGTNSANAVSLTNNNGATFNFSGISLAGVAAALNATGNSTSTVNVSNSNASSINAAGQAVSATGVTLNATFTSVSAAGGTNGISLTTVSGTSNFGTGSLSGSTGIEFVASGGAGSVTYNGTVTQTTGAHVIDVQSKTGGIFAFGGSITSNNGTGQGIFLNGNTGATFNFTAGMALSTGANPAFTATGGGTVSATQNNTSIVNTLATTTGVALNVANTNIGASGLTFRSISANGSANGIILNTTGASGGLTVTGNTGTCTSANTSGCSGGTIQNTTGADDSGTTPAGTGIVLNSTNSVSLTRMFIHDHSNYGLRGTSVTGLTVDTCVMNGVNGTNAPASAGSPFNEGTVKIDNLAGSASITNSFFSGGISNNIRVDNTSTTVNRITFTGNTIGSNSTNNGEDGILLESENTGRILATLTSNTFTSARGDLFNFITNAASGSADDLIFNSNTLSNNHPAIATGGGGTTISSNGTKDLTFHMEGNTFRDAVGTGVLIVKSTGTANLSGTFTNNGIGVAAVANSGSAEGSGLKVQSAGGGTVTVAITNNNIHQYNNNGIELLTGGGATAQSGNFNATITGNTVDSPGNTAGTISIPKNAIQLNGGTVPGDTYAICADIGGAGALANNIFNGGKDASPPTIGDNDMRLRQRQSTTVRLPGYGGAATDTTAVQNFEIARNSAGGVPTALAFGVNSPPGGGYVGGAACTQPTTGPVLASIQFKSDLLRSTGTSDIQLSDPFILGNTKEQIAVVEPVESVLGEGAASGEVIATTPGQSTIEPKSVIAEIYDKLASAIEPTVYAQETNAPDSPAATINVDAGGAGFTIPAGGSITIKYRATVNNGPFNSGVDTIDNQASVAFNPASSVNSNIASIALDAAPDLSVTSSDAKATTQPGVTNAYTLSYANGLGSAANNLQGAYGATVSATVPQNTTFNAGASSGGGGWACAPNNSAGAVCTNNIAGPIAVNTGAAAGTLTFAVDVVQLPPAATTKIDLATVSITESAEPVPPNRPNNGPDLNAANNAAATESDNIIGVWNGTGTDWTLPGSWSNNTVPTTQNVAIPSDAANPPSIPAATAITESKVFLAKDLTIGSGSTLTATSTFSLGTNKVTGAGTLIIDNGATITRTSGQVNCSLQKNFQNGAIAEGLAEDTDPKTANALAATFTFPVGTVAGFFPVDVTPTGGSTGSLTVLAVDNPTGTLAPLTASKTLGRYWTLTGGAGITADVKFSYAPINAAPPPGTKVNGTESNYKPQRVTGGVATSFADICGGGPCVDETNHFIFMPGVTNFAGNWTASELAPTAAQVGVSGRVLSADGHAIRGVRVTLDDGTGRQMSVISNAFGYYYFSEVQAGGTYLLGATARNYTFTPRVLSVNDALTDVDLTALP